MTLVIAPKKVALILIALAVSLTLISIVSQFLLHAIGSQLLPSQYQYKLLFHFRRLFDVYGEGNVPTFFSALLLFSGSVLLTIVAFAKKTDGILPIGWGWPRFFFSYRLMNPLTFTNQWNSECANCLTHQVSSTMRGLFPTAFSRRQYSCYISVFYSICRPLQKYCFSPLA
jgi:hypothetical protein